MGKLKIFYTLCLFYLSNSVSFGQEKSMDTVQALVQYGNKSLMEQKFYAEKNKIQFLDSIIRIYPEKKEDYEFVRKNIYADHQEKLILMDSLFHSEPIRYDLINELENMIFYITSDANDNRNENQDLTGDSEFPSNLLYQNWSTKNFKNQSDIKNDSSYLIQLIQSNNNAYCHPVCKSSIKKYSGLVTSRQGWRDGKRHNGVDINMDQWDSVLCAFDGKVRFVKEFEGYGKVVVVRHFNGLETIYAHLAKFKVKSGQNIKSGDLIGLAGSTGNSEGSHLHFEIRFKDQVLNPENIIDFKNYSLRSDSILIRKTSNSFVAVPVSQGKHCIERGDYPMKIAVRYGMDIAYFSEINKIQLKEKLKVGDYVIIK